ncbi:MAG: aminopeptidase [Janthinobacterium lividum]
MNAITPTAATHDARLDRLAKVAVDVGLALAHGQELVVTAPLDAVPLVRRITEHAYRAGCPQVTTLLTDDVTTLARYQFAPDDAFDRAPAWLYEGMAAAYRSGAARLAISGDDPALLSAQDPARVSRANRARSVAYRPALELITNFAINWSIVSYASPAWARRMFPDLDKAQAVARLWDAIFAASRVDQPDPVAAWAAHNAALHARTETLNAQRFHALRFRGPGTDLRVGLSDGHLWLGGSEPAKNGITCNPNIPTEEVFTTPHMMRVDGHVRSTKPLSYGGTLIQDIAVRFEGGQITDAQARTGQEVLQKVLGTDDGARRLGEVALVPGSSPISASGLLFFNTLFDENAASHIALGQAYRTCLQGGTTAPDDELARRGANTSLIHIDWMIGSGEVDVDGLDAAGAAVPVMRAGEWV